MNSTQQQNSTTTTITNQSSRTLWLGDLQPFMDEPYLQTLCVDMGIYPQITSIKIIRDKQTGQSLKYGFLQFDSHRTAQKFMQQNNGKMFPNVAHKYFRIKWASYGGGVKPGNIIPTSIPGEIAVYVGDLDPSVDENKLLEIFVNKYPSACKSKIIYDATTKLSKGYGFVKFTNQTEAQRAITQCNGQQFYGRTLKVSHAYMKNKEESKEEEEQNQTEAGQMIKVYQQYYSMMNDPVLKAAYQKQMEQSFGTETNTKKGVRQSLENLRSLTYEQTKPSENYIQMMPRWLSNSAKKSVESQIFCG